MHGSPFRQYQPIARISILSVQCGAPINPLVSVGAGITPPGIPPYGASRVRWPYRDGLIKQEAEGEQVVLLEIK